MAAARIAAALTGDKAQRATAYGQLVDLSRSKITAETVSVVVGCIRPLVERIFPADVAVVDAEEWATVQLVVMEMIAVEPVLVIGEYFRPDEQGAFHTGQLAWGSPDNAYQAVFRKEPSALTKEDALLVSLNAGFHSWDMARGMQACLTQAGLDPLLWFATMGGSNRMMAGQPTSIAVCQRLALLGLEIIRKPVWPWPAGTGQGEGLDYGSGGGELSELALSGVWMMVNWAMSSRGPVAMALIEAGVIEEGLSRLHSASPIEWVSYSTSVGVLAASIIHLGWSLSTTELPVNKTSLLIEKGFIDVCISVMKAFELRGVTKVPEANAGSLHGVVTVLSTLDLEAPEAEPIVRQLESIHSALRFLLDNPVVVLQIAGLDTGAQGSVVCSLAFGKEEGDGGANKFQFTQANLKQVPIVLLEVFSGTMARWTPELPPFFIRPAVALCISDTNKQQLLESASAGLLQLLLEALLLDTSHTRQNQPEAVKAAIQRDAAECLLQIALCDSGRALLVGDGVVMDVLRALTEGRALTDEAVISAHGALMALEGRSPHETLGTGRGGNGNGSEDEGNPQHVMLSYQWNVQTTIVRIVRSLQQRDYDVWLDLDRMKGSTVDAMGAAVDDAAVVLYGVSKAYKESANCRLEANYAHQQDKDMVPLMMQENFRPKGWLGVILGSRMWYAFFDSAHDTEPSFEKRIDALVREIGERGLLRHSGAAAAAAEATARLRSGEQQHLVAEGVPPSLVATDVRAVAAAPAVSQRVSLPSAPAGASSSGGGGGGRALERRRGDFTPSVQMRSPMLQSPSLTSSTMSQSPQQQPPQHQQQLATTSGGGGGIGSLGELSAFMERQWVHDAQLRQEMEHRLEQIEQKSELKLAQLREALSSTAAAPTPVSAPAQPPPLISNDQLAALQTRLQRLQEAEMLSGDELYCLENLIADFLEIKASVAAVLTSELVHSTPGDAFGVACRLAKLIGVSEGIAVDESFARQCRRKFCSE